MKLKMNEYPASCLLESEYLPPPLLDLTATDCHATATTPYILFLILLPYYLTYSITK